MLILSHKIRTSPIGLGNLSIHIAPYNAERDFFSVFELWQTVFAQAAQDAESHRWSLTAPLLHNVIANPLVGQHGTHFVAIDNDDSGGHEAGEHLIGFIATQLNPNPAPAPPTGYVLVVLVHPDQRRKRIGTALLTAAVDSLRTAGAARIVIGGKYPRIWPGVPDTLADSLPFFEAQGWQFDHVDYDLVRDLSDYQTPAHVYEKLIAENVTITPANSADVPAVLAFEHREFAGWADTYDYVAHVGDHADFLVARDPAVGVIGALLMVSPHSHPARVDVLWKPWLGEKVGGLGEVGVAASQRGRGVGLALVAIGSDVLKARGVANCNIGYTSLVDFYGRLGYRPWQRYQIASRTF